MRNFGRRIRGRVGKWKNHATGTVAAGRNGLCSSPIFPPVDFEVHAVSFSGISVSHKALMG